MSSRLIIAALAALLAAPAVAADCGLDYLGDGRMIAACEQLSGDVEAYKAAQTPQDRKAALDKYLRDRESTRANLDDKDRVFANSVPQLVTALDAQMADAGAAAATDAVRDVAKTVRDTATKLTPDAPAQPVEDSAPKNSLTSGAQNDLKAGDPGAAIKKLNQTLAQNKDDPQALGLLAQAKLATGDREGALAAAKRAQELNPGDPATKALISGLEGAQRAAAKFGKSKLDFGGQRLPDGAGAGAGGPPAGRGGASPPVAQRAPATGAMPPAEGLLIQRVRQLLDIGDLTGAMLPLREAVDLDPKNVELWDMLAEVSNKLANPQGAIDAADHALALDPKDARALRAKSYAEFQLGRYKEALADAERAIALDPGSGLGYLYRAMAEEKLGDLAKALEDYRTAVRLDPTLAPLAAPALKRLGAGSGSAPDGSPWTGRRGALRVGAIGLSTALIILGLMGTATGRALTQGARRLITPVPPAARGEDAPVTLQPGALVDGHYRITRELGRGGMGVVYLAQDESLRRPVAIKQLQREGRGSPEDVERFLREARLVAQLKHPNLAQIFSVVSDGDLLLVFEYVEGEPLDALLSRARALAPARVRRVVDEVCAALQCAHERKIVHRDLKPANVMIEESGAAKVMDFGIAHQARGGGTMTQTSVSGTPPYMSPEQGMGSVSKASDLYALAVMTYEMLTGVRPFPGPDFLEQKLGRRFLPASQVVPSLGSSIDEFFMRALDPDPTKRPADAAAFALAFRRALDSTPSRA